MPTTFLLRCALIGATTGLIIRIIMLFVKKQPRSTWPPHDTARGPLANSWLVTFLNENKFILLKTAISGAILGIAGGFAGYTVSTWVAGFSQHWLILFLSAIIAPSASSGQALLLWAGFSKCCLSAWSGAGWVGAR